MREEISTTPERREIPFRRFYGCDIGDPFGLWGPNAKLAIEQIGNHGIAVIALRGPTRRRLRCALIPRARIKRAMRLRPHRSPRSCSSA